jgi:type II secretory pathway pseudopilin PulG
MKTMKPARMGDSRQAAPAYAPWRAFTITEVMVAMALLSMVVIGVLSGHFFGMRLFQLTKAKLGASEEARMALNRLTDEIRSAKVLDVGTGSLSSFVECGIGTLQQGNALQIYTNSDTNTFIRYFRDPADKKLKRTVNGLSAVSIVANAITNTVLFTSEDHLGTVLTNGQNNRVIGLKLEFYQIAYPVVSVGPGGLFDYYQLSTRITRRAFD